jgi:TolB-like protein/tetratricopeptide (TPR) repeat protein
LIARHRGHVFSSAGDGLVAEFPSIVEAIRCALAIQKEVSGRNADLPKNQQMRFRIGVNLGDVIVEGNNLYGTGVNVAVRLEQMAEPGGILISQTVYDQVRKIVEIPFEDIGERRLKNISEPIRVYRVHSGPLPWTKRWLSRTRLRRQAGTAAGILFLLLFLVAAGALYLRDPNAPLSFLGDLRAPARPDHASVAVMPFIDDSQTKDQEYLGNGIAASVIWGLGQFPDVSVMGRSTSFKYKGVDARQVGKDLNVRYVVEGSVEKSEKNNLLVFARLIDADTGSKVWDARYDRQIDDQGTVSSIRNDITTSIVGALGGLQGKLAKAEMERLSGKEPKSFAVYASMMMEGLSGNEPKKFDAYAWLMKGWDEWDKAVYETSYPPAGGCTPDDNGNRAKAHNEAARKYFYAAAALNPNWSRPYAGLAWTDSMDYDFEWTDDYVKTAKDALANATRAVELDDNDYQAHWALGWARLYNWERDKALESYKRAFELNSNDPDLLAEMANLLIYLDRPKEAVTQLNEAIRLNPRHPKWYSEYLGWAYWEAGMYPEAIQMLEAVAQPCKEHTWLLIPLASAYAEVGRVDDADKTVKTILSFEPEFRSKEDFACLSPYSETRQSEVVKALVKAGLPEGHNCPED